MADIYVPGVRSRFDTDKIIEGLMQVERLPRNRVEATVTSMESQKTYWQDLGRRMSSMRESARTLYSFQNPFNERLAVSEDSSVLTAQANREASETEHFFAVKQTAEADRFLSLPLDPSYKIPAGEYRFTAGDSEVAFTFRGGSVTEFSDMLNRRGSGKVQSRVVNVDKTSKAFFIESTQTGANARLGFGDAALTLALDLGILVKDDAATTAAPATTTVSASQLVTAKPDAPSVQPSPIAAAQTKPAPQSPPLPEPVTIYIKPVSSRGNIGASELALEQLQGGASTASPMSTLDIPLNDGIPVTRSMMLKFETEITAPLTGRHVMNSLMLDDEETAARNTQNLNVLSLVFDDGTSAALPAISGETGYRAQQYALASIAGDKTISFIRIENTNTSREVSLRNIQLFDPTPVVPEADPSAPAEAAPAETLAEAIDETEETGDIEIAAADDGIDEVAPHEAAPNPGYRPRQPVSTARDAVITMDGIEVTRPANNIDDLLPGVTLTVRAPSERPVRLGIEPDRESVKDSLITLVGNYNRLMADLNVVSRTDPIVIDELTYLTDTEREDLRKRLGVFSGDSSLSQMRTALQNTFTSPYRLNDGRSVLLSEFGIGTDVQRQGGYDRSKLRGYMQIDEKTLDTAIAARLPDLQALFGLDTDGDLIIDSGLAFNLDRIIRPYVETGGIIALKTSSLDRSIGDGRQRIESIDRQLATKEQTLRTQYGQMENVYNQMERMSSTLENFGNSNR
ncbi:MAG: flagellar filament capping protein FliD [Spirochaetaceae bacterium]|nr:flagellar filament capping protein FliD [Spirochaetaceae bacterium]